MMNPHLLEQLIQDPTTNVLGFYRLFGFGAANEHNLRYWMTERKKVEAADEVSDYLLCALLALEESNVVINYLEARGAIKDKSEFLAYLKQHEKLNWIKNEIWYFLLIGNHREIWTEAIKEKLFDPNISIVWHQLAINGRNKHFLEAINEKLFDPNTLITNDGSTVWHMLAKYGHSELLFDAIEQKRFDPNTLITKDGSTVWDILAYEHPAVWAKALLDFQHHTFSTPLSFVNDQVQKAYCLATASPLNMDKMLSDANCNYNVGVYYALIVAQYMKATQVIVKDLYETILQGLFRQQFEQETTQIDKDFIRVFTHNVPECILTLLYSPLFASEVMLTRIIMLILKNPSKYNKLNDIHALLNHLKTRLMDNQRHIYTHEVDGRPALKPEITNKVIPLLRALVNLIPKENEGLIDQIVHLWPQQRWGAAFVGVKNEQPWKDKLDAAYDNNRQAFGLTQFDKTRDQNDSNKKRERDVLITELDDSDLKQPAKKIAKVP